MTEPVRAELLRTGGFAGRPLHVRLDAAQLPPAEAARLTRLVAAIDLAALPAGDRPMPPGADLRSYRLTVEHGDQRWQGTVHDPAVPAPLRPLLRFLTESA